ncbi:hypothetical protein DB41_DC00070 [Neochlamydia sp. TUME1]|nr:hypothetical protein DB41_DC00070 [Neochlamydia sp. TUME1]
MALYFFYCFSKEWFLIGFQPIVSTIQSQIVYKNHLIAKNGDESVDIFFNHFGLLALSLFGEKHF